MFLKIRATPPSAACQSLGGSIHEDSGMNTWTIAVLRAQAASKIPSMRRTPLKAFRCSCCKPVRAPWWAARGLAVGQAGVCGAYRWSHAEAYSCRSQWLTEHCPDGFPCTQSLLQEGLCLNSRAVTMSPCVVDKPRTQGKNPRYWGSQDKVNEPSPRKLRQDTHAHMYSPSHTHNIHTSIRCFLGAQDMGQATTPLLSSLA